ncbi:hypothetical protein BJY04DRAFT_217309 [Aspergillus karnatakaensis]|uniref:fungal specific transcription factor domain-containing protein n=1 Tax=Aspergillus karnatakaensis TaxID=1810916 RepID=UPI003CCE2365
MLGWQYLVELTACSAEVIAKRNSAITKIETAVNGASSAVPVAFPDSHHPIMLPTPIYKVSHKAHDTTDLWHPYPIALESIPAHTKCVANVLTELQLIVCESSSERGHMESQEFIRLYEHLKQWAQDLPQCLSDEAVKSAQSPEIFDLHMRYHSAIVTLCNRTEPIKL